MDKTVRDIPLERIEKNTFNPNRMSPERRASLKEGMKRNGPDHALAIDRLIVSPKNIFYNDPQFDNEHFIIVDGQNRWEIAGELGWTVIRCEIRCLCEELARIMCYRRNRERGTIDPLLEAKLFQTEIDKGLTHERIALAYNVTRSYVSNRMKMFKLDPKVVEVFRKPEESFRRIKEEEFKEKHQSWEKRTAELEEEGRTVYIPEPTIDEKTVVTRGTLSDSHLETVAALPKERQVEVVTEILEDDLTVRDTEKRVRRIKEELADQRKLEEALKVAIRKKCPSCGGDPDRVDSDGRFHCGEKTGYSYCYTSWDPRKTQKQVDEEKKANMSKQEKRASEARTEQFKEARENPKFIRMTQTPEELHELLAPWLMRKILQLTEVGLVRIIGKRGKDSVVIDYNPPSTGYSNMSFGLTLKTKEGKDHRFGFWVEKKDYKKYPAKSRVNLSNIMDRNEESRELIRKFFREVVKTDKDPMKA